MNTRVTTEHEETVSTHPVEVHTPTHVTRTTEVIAPTITTEHPVVAYKKKKAIFRTYQVIWYVLGLIEILFVFRMLLKGLGANPASGFASLIYTLTNPLVLPFSGIFGTSIQNNSVIEWSLLIAAVVYALVAFGIMQLLQFFKPVNQDEVEQTVDNQVPQQIITE